MTETQPDRQDGLLSALKQCPKCLWWSNDPHHDQTCQFASVVVSDDICRDLTESAAPVPSPDGAGERKRWFLASQNDGLFIINSEPRPSNDDQWHDRPDGPSIVLNVTELPEAKAIKIVYVLNELSALPPSATGEAEPVAIGEQQILDEVKNRYGGHGRFQRVFVEGAGWGLKHRATPPVRGDREAIARCIFKQRLKVGDQTADVYFARRENHPHAIDDSTMAVDAAFRDADALIAAGLAIPVQPGAGEREAVLLECAKWLTDNHGLIWQAERMVIALSRQAPQSNREGRR